MADVSTIRVILPVPELVRINVNPTVIAVTAPQFSLNGSTKSVSLVAGNNISLSSNLSTITIIGQAGGVFSLNGSSSSVSLVAGAGISITGNASTITISNNAAFSTITGSMSGNTLGAASTSIQIRDNFLISGGGIVSVGASGANGTITISATTPSMTNYSTITGSMTGNTMIGGGTSVTIGNNFSLSGQGIVSVGASGNIITIAAITDSALTFVTNSLTALGNTTSSSSGTYNSLLNVSGAGIVSVGVGNRSITISATTPSVTNYSTISGSVAGNVGATTTFTIGNQFQISAAGALSATASGSSITLSAPAGGAGYSTITATMTGNTLGTASTTLTVGNSLSISGAGIVSVGASGATLTISATTPSVTNFSTITATMAGNTLGAASTTFTHASTFSVSGGGIVSVGGSGGTITISATSAASASVQSAVQMSGNTSGTSSLISTGTLYLQAVSMIGLSQSTTTGANSTTSNILSIFGPTYAAAGGLSLSTTGGTVSYSGVNTSSISLTALGNTTSSSSGTFSNLLNISGAGIVSVGVGAGSITISATTPSVTNYSTISGNIAGNTAGSSTFTIGNTFQISLTGGLSGTASGSSITLSGATGGAGGGTPFQISGNTSGTSSLITAGTLFLQASSMLYLSQSTTTGANSTTSNVITIGGPAYSVGGGLAVSTTGGTVSITGPTQTTLVAGSNISLTSGGSSITINGLGAPVSMTQNVDLKLVAGTIVSKSGTVTGTAGVGSSLFLHRLPIHGLMQLTEIDVAMSIGFPATSQGAGTLSRSMVIYSFGNSTSLATVMSVSGTSAWGTGTSTAGASSSLTQFQGGWSSPLIQPMTFAATSLAPGDYVVGQLFNFAQGSSTWTINLYGAQGESTSQIAAVTGITSASLGALSSGGLSAASGINALTQNATNNISWFVSRATSAVTSVASATSSFTFLEAPFVGSIGTVAGSILIGSTSINAVTNVGLAASGSSTVAVSALPNFGYIGTGSTTSGFPTAFLAVIMSTGAIPTAITITSTAVTYSGSAAFQQPWFALIGS